ncbi:MAG TPA: porin family protein [Rhodanobacteraceae bacterium]|nr:porin family protein [Rhodanobacteraceae bacterium]
MKNTLIAIALATAGLSAVPLTSHAADQSGFFINGNVGQSNVNKGLYDDDDTGFGANVGYRWAVAPSVLLGVEGGYTDLGKFSTKDQFNGAGIPDAKLSGWNLGVNGHFNITPNWYVSGRTGWFRADVKGGYIDPNDVVVRVDDTSDKWYAGAGFGYDFSNNFSVGLNYDYYKADKKNLDLNSDLVSVSAEYRF